MAIILKTIFSNSPFESKLYVYQNVTGIPSEVYCHNKLALVQTMDRMQAIIMTYLNINT